MSSQPTSRFESYPPEQVGVPGGELPGDVGNGYVRHREFKGRSARLLAELRIGDTGGGLLTARILTAKPTSVVAGRAQQNG